MTTTVEHAERFTHLRPLLFTIVYEILGSTTESDDVLQDSYLRWAAVDLATVRDTKSYLAQGYPPRRDAADDSEAICQHLPHRVMSATSAPKGLRLGGGRCLGCMASPQEDLT